MDLWQENLRLLTRHAEGRGRFIDASHAKFHQLATKPALNSLKLHHTQAIEPTRKDCWSYNVVRRIDLVSFQLGQETTK
jgi:hypothetical protein